VLWNITNPLLILYCTVCHFFIHESDGFDLCYPLIFVVVVVVVVVVAFQVNNITDIGVHYIAYALVKNSTLTKLDLQGVTSFFLCFCIGVVTTLNDCMIFPTNDPSVYNIFLFSK